MLLTPPGMNLGVTGSPAGTGQPLVDMFTLIRCGVWGHLGSRPPGRRADGSARMER